MSQKTDNGKEIFLSKEFTQYDIDRTNLEGMASAYSKAIHSFTHLVVEEVGSHLSYGWEEKEKLWIICHRDLQYAMSHEFGRNYSPNDGEAYNRIEERLYPTNRRGWSHKQVNDYFPKATGDIPAITWSADPGAGFIAQYNYFMVEADFEGDWRYDVYSCQEYLLQWRMYNKLFGSKEK